MDNRGFQGEETDKQRKQQESGKLGEDGGKAERLSWGRRHAQGLRTLLPFRTVRKESGARKILPLNDIGCVSYLTVGWLTATMWKAFKVGLVPSDLFYLAGPEDAARNGVRFERLWQEERDRCQATKKKPSLARAAWRFGRTRFLISLSLVSISMFFQFAGPSLVLKYMLDYLEDPLAPSSTGIALVVCLFLTQSMRNITFNMQQSIGIHLGIRLLSGVEYCGFSKLLRLRSPDDAALGQLITFITADHERIQDAVVTGPLFIGTPFMFLMSIVYSTYLVGPSALVGSLVILLFYPIMGVIAALTAILRLRVVTLTDKRVTMMGEIINSMRLIKMYAWEIPFIQRVEEVRKKEIKELRKSALMQSLSSTISPSITIVAGFATFLTMTLAEIELNTTEAFTILSIFNAMQFSVGTLPWSLKMITEATVGFGRLQQLLELKDYVHPSNRSSKSSQESVQIFGASLAWEVEEARQGKMAAKAKKEKEDGKKKDGISPMEEGIFVDCLYDLNLNVRSGELLGVAGAVGAGKTSLISAIMGEMKLQRGGLKVSGSLALVSQQAWIFNATLRDNILMGSPMQEAWYHQVLEACALAPDLKSMAEGDMTEIGERGVTLSGGQKQRVNLARALYADMDVYLLDDPLSAVDAKVGQHIFNKYVQVMLRHKTVLLVTHGMQFLKQCDRLVFLKDGRIAEEGRHEDLLEKKDGLYANMVMYDAKRNVAQDKKPTRKRLESTLSTLSEILSSEEPALQKAGAGESSGDDRGWAALFTYLHHCASYPVQLFLFLSIVLFVLLRLSTSIWLQRWMDDGDGLEEARRANTSWTSDLHSLEEFQGIINNNPRLGFYQLNYGLIICAMLVFGFLKGAGLLVTLTRGALKVHGLMLKSIMNSPMAFFDQTPSGRILNRFSKNIDEMDTPIPFLLEAVTQFSMMCLSQVLLVCVLFPYFIIAFVVIAAVFIMLDRTMNSGVLEAKKLDNMMKTPVIHHITSSMAGVTIIRGFNKEEVFKARFASFLNQSMSADCLFRLAQRWFMWRMDSVGLVVIIVTAIVVVATKGSVSPALGGLAMATIFQVSTFIPFVMKLKSEFRARVNSLERIGEYIALSQEAAHFIPEMKPAASWPPRGLIVMTRVNFRYRPDLPLVLREVTVTIGGGMKVGIVGRTGAGKSSLISTLLRLVELDGGSIVVDGVNISEIGLADLRSAVAVIPQDPVLFQGTVRYNIDPFDAHTDEEVWRALERANLKKKVSGDKLALLMGVEAEGENFSVGEKQLICLARALLRRNKILLLDEATASVDVETDHAIQATIQDAFSGCTVLTIAHRLNTVMGYDLVLVLDQGRVVESGPPGHLLNSGGTFEDMAAAAGLKN